MLKRDVVSLIAKKRNINSSVAEQVLDDALEAITEALRLTGAARLPRFGTFRIREGENQRRLAFNPDPYIYDRI